MTKAFKKGQEVTYIADWDRKGTYMYQHAIVYSCGKKQMVLTDAETGREMGRNYNPSLGRLEAGTEMKNGVEYHCQPGGTFPRMTDEEAEAQCLKMAAAANQGRKEYYEGLKLTAWASAPEVMDKEIAALHEPRALNRTGSN